MHLLLTLGPPAGLERRTQVVEAAVNLRQGRLSVHQCLSCPQVSIHPLAALTAAEVVVACYDVWVAALVAPSQVLALVTAHGCLALILPEHQPLQSLLVAMQ